MPHFVDPGIDGTGKTLFLNALNLVDALQLQANAR